MSGELLTCACCKESIPRGDTAFGVCSTCLEYAERLQHWRRKAVAAEAEVEKLKVAVEQARADALSNLERLISVEAENKRLREALKQISKNEYGCPDAECIDCHCTWCVARRALGGEG